MKRGTPHHPKTGKLARLLKIKQFSAVGLLECLWHWTAKYAIQGDVGKFSDQELANACFWEKEPKKLVDALVEAGWLDVDTTHRLLVHDWQEHADQSVQKTIRNRGLVFWNHSGKVQKGLTTSVEKVSPSLSLSHSHSHSQKPKPVSGKIQKQKTRGSAAFSPGDVELPKELDTPQFREAWKTWVRSRIEIKHPLTPTAVDLQLKRLAAWGPVRAAAALDFTGSNAWQGIREPDAPPGEQTRPRINVEGIMRQKAAEAGEEWPE